MSFHLVTPKRDLKLSTIAQLSEHRHRVEQPLRGKSSEAATSRHPNLVSLMQQRFQKNLAV